MFPCSYKNSTIALKKKLYAHQASASKISIKFIEIQVLQTWDINNLSISYLTPREQSEFQTSQRPWYYIGKHMVSKIAFFDIYEGNDSVQANQLEIEHDSCGQPYFSFDGKVLDYCLSISDELHLVAACCCKAS